MATLGSGGAIYHSRLVTDEEDPTAGKPTAIFSPRLQENLRIKPENLAEIKRAMTAVVSGTQNPAHAAAVDGIAVAGATGNVQQSFPATTKKTYSWFAGFAPADHPTYAFAVLTENTDEPERGSSTTVAIGGKVLRELFKKDAAVK